MRERADSFVTSSDSGRSFFCSVLSFCASVKEGPNRSPFCFRRLEGKNVGRATRNRDEIGALRQSGLGAPKNFATPTLHAIADDGVTQAPSNDDAETSLFRVTARANDKMKMRRTNPNADAFRFEKLRTLPQPSLRRKCFAHDGFEKCRCECARPIARSLLTRRHLEAIHPPATDCGRIK